MNNNLIIGDHKNEKGLVFYFPFIIFFVSIAFNLLYFNWKDAPVIAPDSAGYISFAENIKNFQMPGIFYRTPVYPLYLLLFGINLKLAAYGQIIIGALSNVLLYLIGVRLFKNKWLVFLSVIFVSSDLFIANFNSSILTESISTFLLLLSLYLHIKILTESLSRKLIIFTLMADIFLIFVRPNLAFLPIVINVFSFLYFLIYQRKGADFGKMAKIFVSGILIYSILILGFCSLNLRQNGHFTISGISNVNMLGKLVQYDMIRVNEKATGEIPESAKTIIQIHKELLPNTKNQRDQTDADAANRFDDRLKMFQSIIVTMNRLKLHLFIPYADKLYAYMLEDWYKVDPYSIYNDLSKNSPTYFNDISQANNYYLENNGVSYSMKTIRNTPKAMMFFGDFYAMPDNIQSKAFFYNIRYFYIFLSLITPITLFIFLSALLFYTVKKNREKIAVLGLIMLSIFYTISIISALGYSGYYRLKMPVNGLIEMLSLIIILMAIHKLSRTITNAFSKNNR